ncbi:MAG: hypothetical protein SGPRY_005980 [Prymnesium sp.]
MAAHLDSSCPVTHILPYVHNLDQAQAEQWIEHASDSYLSSLPLAIVLVTVSVALLFFGAKLTRPVLFVCGALVSFIAGFWLTDKFASGASATVACWLLAIIPLVLGILGGLLALHLLNLAFFCVGLAAGAAVAQEFFAVFLDNDVVGAIVVNREIFSYVFVAAVALICGMLMVCLKESLMIYATAAIGAIGLVPGLAILALSRIDKRFLWAATPSAASQHQDSPFVYGQAFACLLYFLIGVHVQKKQAMKQDGKSMV